VNAVTMPKLSDSMDEGVIVTEGATLRVGELIARIGTRVEDAPAPLQNLPAPNAEATPPASANGVGALRQVPALDNGALVGRRLATLTLSCDHRILYGADAAQFLGTIRSLLERPLAL
jgi:pyruvate/2-oxoglutarate dehydrogenase complex dihydrolipoamide acyltransferase (E2) component